MSHREKFELIILFDKPMLFLPEQNKDFRYPTCLHKFDIRYDENYDPVALERTTGFHFYGSVLCKDDLEIPQDDYVPLNEDSIEWVPYEMSVSDFYEKTLSDLNYVIKKHEINY